MMPGRPDAHLETLVLERAHRCVGESGLELHAPAGCVQARARDRIAGRQRLVENAGRDLE